MKDLQETGNLELLEAGGRGPGHTNRYRVICQQVIERPTREQLTSPKSGVREKSRVSKGDLQRVKREKAASVEPSVNHHEPSFSRPEGRERKDEFRESIARHFSELAGIPHPELHTEKQRKEAGRLWFAPIREICSLANWKERHAKGLMNAAFMRLNGLTVSDPNSILKTCRAIAGEIKRGKYHE